MSEENSNININEPTEGTDSEQENPQQKIAVGLSPLGGIGINISGTDGSNAGATLSIEEVEQLAARLMNLAGVLLHMGYIQMAQEQMEASAVAQKLGITGTNSKIILPGR